MNLLSESAPPHGGEQKISTRRSYFPTKREDTICLPERVVSRPTRTNNDAFFFVEITFDDRVYKTRWGKGESIYNTLGDLSMGPQIPGSAGNVFNNVTYNPYGNHMGGLQGLLLSRWAGPSSI